MAQTDIFTRPTTQHREPFGRRLRLTTLFDLWRSRQVLAKLDQAALQDIGISAKDAAREASKPVWDVPLHWRD